MKGTLLKILFLWAVSLPALAWDESYFLNSSAAYNGCRSGTSYPCTSVGPICSAPNDNDAYVRNGAGDNKLFCSVSSCPSGTVASGTSCVAAPTGPTQQQKDNARKKATDNAKKLGFDQAAQDAAAAAAEQTLADWLAAGKSEADALKAAEAAGTIAAAEDAINRPSVVAAREKMRTDTIACYSAGRSNCEALAVPYYNALAATGMPGQGGAFTFRTADPNNPGKELEYTLLSNGSWDAFQVGEDGKPYKYLGNSPSMLPFSPTASTQNNGQPVVPSQATGGTTAIKDTQVITSKQDRPAVATNVNTNPTISYFGADGSVDAVATMSPNGTTTCTGAGCGSYDYANDLNGLKNSPVWLGGGAGSGNGHVQVDDPAGSVDGSLSGEKGAFDAASDQRKSGVQGIGGKGQSDEGGLLSWVWFPDIPATACADPSITVGSRSLTFDGFCEKAGWIRDIAAFALYILTAFSLFNILTGRNSQGDK